MTDSTPHAHPTPHGQQPHLPFLRRMAIAVGAFFRILSDARFAASVACLNHPDAPAPTAPVAAAPAPLAAERPDAALQLLALLQRDARLIDFTQENLSNYTDADIGAAARVVHEGCRKVLSEHFTIAQVRQEAEGSQISLADGFDARAIRLTGNVVGTAPYKGSIRHCGWRATEVRLPKLTASHDATVLAQAEVEL